LLIVLSPLLDFNQHVCAGRRKIKKRPPRMRWAFHQFLSSLINLAGFAQRPLEIVIIPIIIACIGEADKGHFYLKFGRLYYEVGISVLYALHQIESYFQCNRCIIKNVTLRQGFQAAGGKHDESTKQERVVRRNLSTIFESEESREETDSG
jgi:hypothetical protein